jgi:hypothetical protein
MCHNTEENRMRIHKALAVGVSGCAIAAAAVVPATAGAAHASHPALTHGTLHSSISSTTAHTGTKLTLKASGAKKKTSYLCLFALVKGTQHGQDLNNTSNAKSTKKGKFHCTLTFKPFTATVAGKLRHCPLTKADKKAHVVCGFAAADPADQNSNAFWPINAKK